MSTTDEPDSSEQIQRNTAAIVDNINKSEGYFFAELMTADYYDDLANAIHELDVIEIQRKWTQRQVELSRFSIQR